MKKIIPALIALSLFYSCSKKDAPVIPDPVTPVKPDTLSPGWTKFQSLPVQGFTDIFFTDINNGFATSDQGIYRSVNGGELWNKVYTGGNYINIAAFGNKACFTNNTNSILTTQNAGSSFSVSSNNVALSPPVICDCFYTGTNVCYASSAKYIWKSLNGGLSFDSAYNFPASAGSNSLFFLNDLQGWIVRGDGVYKTTNGGTSWSYSTGQSTMTGTIYFTDQNNGYYSNDSGSVLKIYKTTNAGASWQVCFQTASDPIYTLYADLHFVSATTGYFSFRNRIYKTVNAGSSWTPVVSLGDGSFIEIHFTDANHGWAITTSGTVIRLVQ